MTKMNKKETFFGCGDIFFFSLAIMSSALFSNLPSILVRTAGNGAPLSAALSGVAVLLLIFLISKKLCTRQNSDLITLAEARFGTIGKYVVSILLLLYLFLSSLYFLSELSEFCKLLAFPTSPLWFVVSFFIIAATAGAFGGTESLLRISRLTVPMFSTVFLLLVVSVLAGSDFANLFPLLGKGTDKVLSGSLSGIILYSDIVIVFMLIPFSHYSKARSRAVFSGASLSVLFVFLLLLAYTAKIPYPLSQLERFPLYLLSKEVYFGRFFQRMDAILLLYSSIIGMLSLSAKLYLVASILTRTFGITAKVVRLLPMSVILFLLASGSSLFPESILTIILLSAGTGIFAILALTALFSRKERSAENEK